MEGTGRFAGMGLLIVDDEPLVCEFLQEDLNELSDNGLSIITAHSIESALERLSESPIHVIILDKDLSKEKSDSSSLNGIESIPLFLNFNSRVRILIHTSSGDIQDVVRAMKLGAVNYLPKDGTKGTSRLVLEQVSSTLEQARILEKNMRLQRGDKSHSVASLNIESKSPIMRALLERLKRFAVTDEPVILLGESGVGKSTLAGYVHKLRFEGKDVPFIEQSFNSLGQNVFEAELFGSVKGAFTDAVDKIGYLEAANGGTLFIDEIGELSLEAQAKLLTALETGMFNRVGESTRKRKSKFRLITATNKNPEDLVKQGKLREDFYARICTFQLDIPSLKDRPEDIPDLIKSVLPAVAESTHYNVSFEMLPKEFIGWVRENPPKLNIRGVRSILAHLIALSKEDRFGVRDFSSWKALLSESKVQTSRAKQSKTEITWKDVMNSNSFITEDFPGMREFTGALEKKLIRENSMRIADFSKITKISQATIFRRKLKHGGAKS